MLCRDLLFVSRHPPSTSLLAAHCTTWTTSTGLPEPLTFNSVWSTQAWEDMGGGKKRKVKVFLPLTPSQQGLPRTVSHD